MQLRHLNRLVHFPLYLKYLQYYLELQQMTHDFSSEFDIAEGEYLNTRCARFLLQPIAENAVCHNMDEFGTLWVEASEQDGKITIRIQDDGKGFEISEKMEQKAKDELQILNFAMTLKTGYTITVKGVTYRVTNAEAKTAEAYGVVNKNQKHIEVAATVKIKGSICKV